MKLIKKLVTKDINGIKKTYNEYFIENDNNYRILIKPVFQEDKKLLSYIAERDK